MHFAERILIAVSLHVGPARCPTRAQQHDRTSRNFAVAGLPYFHTRCIEQIVRVFLALGSYVNHDGRTEKLFHRNFVNRNRSRRKVNRRVEVCAVVFEHPEASCKDAVLRDGSVIFGLKKFAVARPGYEFVVDRVAEVDHLSATVGNVAQQIVLRRVLSEERHGGEEGNTENRETAEPHHAAPPRSISGNCAANRSATDSKPASRVDGYGSGIPGVATMPAMRRIS